MQAYNASFAKIYNMRWGDFAQYVAPFLRSFYETKPVSQANQTVLDLCCGTGQLAVLFLEAGYRVVSLDLSAPMLAHAKENAYRFIETGQARFVQGDARNFELDERFGLIISTYDAMNHLESETALRECFQSVFSTLEDRGVFIFDLNTRLGLRRWNGINVDDCSDEVVIINRGIYDPAGDKAWARITGFVQEKEGFYRRFEETVFNTLFEVPRVIEALQSAGWKNPYCACLQELQTPLLEPEKEERVFFVACK